MLPLDAWVHEADEDQDKAHTVLLPSAYRTVQWLERARADESMLLVADAMHALTTAVEQSPNRVMHETDLALAYMARSSGRVRSFAYV